MLSLKYQNDKFFCCSVLSGCALLLFLRFQTPTKKNYFFRSYLRLSCFTRTIIIIISSILFFLFQLLILFSIFFNWDAHTVKQTYLSKHRLVLLILANKPHFFICLFVNNLFVNKARIAPTGATVAPSIIIK